jgi:hypothetical protein
MKMLMTSASTLPAAPSGPAYVAGVLRQAGHTVDIYEGLVATNLQQEITGQLHLFQPDVVGVSIRLVHGDPAAPFGTCYLELRPGF